MSIVYLIYRSNLQCPSIAGWINMQGDILFNSCHKAQSNVDHIPDISIEVICNVDSLQVG